MSDQKNFGKNACNQIRKDIKTFTGGLPQTDELSWGDVEYLAIVCYFDTLAGRFEKKLGRVLHFKI